MALTERKHLLQDIFDVLSGRGNENRNFITQKEFCEKWDFEIDYTNNILTFWKEEDNELDEEERTYHTITIQ